MRPNFRRALLAFAGANALSAACAASDGQETEQSLIDRVVVTGSHIRGVENNTVPITVLDRDYIDSTGFSTTTQLIESLPQNFSSVNQSASVGLATGTTGNSSQGSSVNLRATGQGTTLVLINGRRLAPGMVGAAVDISSLPLSAIERVEILTDGASALYGSDAIGGVVNFILRDDFEGAETRLQSGWADDVDQYRLSQALGGKWDSGNALASVEYYERDLLWARDRDFVPSTVRVGSLLPEDRNYSALLTGQQKLSDSVRIFGDALHMRRDSVNFADLPTPLSGYQPFTSNTRQTVADLGLRWQFGGEWQVEAIGNYAENDARAVSATGNFRTAAEFNVRGAQAKLDGSLLELPGGAVSLALGAEWREESLTALSVNRSTQAVLVSFDLDQIVRGAFGEVYIPIVGSGNAIAAVRRLELSIAGRYDEYSSFGSSFDPQAGIMWEPFEGFRLRGSRGTSYKPPNLNQYLTTINGAQGFTFLDPVFGRNARMLLLQGADPDSYRPQESDNYAIGVEFAPTFIDSLRVGVNYYEIEYKDRIAQPASAALLANNPAYASLITRNPTPAQIDAAVAAAQLGRGISPATFNPALTEVILDGRTRNLSLTKTRGLDVSVDYRIKTRGGDIQLGLAGTRIYELVQQVIATGPEAENVGTIYNPPKWKARGSAGWAYERWSLNLAVNYGDSSLDIRRTPFRPISSYTTVDSRVAYAFGEHSPGFLSGVTMAVNAQNLLDEDPPSTVATAGSFDIGFDPTNASPLGRFVSVEVSKLW